MEFEKLFIESLGQPVNWNGKKIYLSDKIEFNKTLNLRITILHVDSSYPQGVTLSLYPKKNGDIIYEGESFGPRIVLWHDKWEFEPIELKVQSKNSSLFIANCWSRESIRLDSGHNGAAMQVDIREDGSRLYRCNDWEPDEDFDDIVFKVEFLNENV